MSSITLKLESIEKRVGDFTLCADLEIAAGTRAGLTGRSGSGKTTLLRMIAGLDAPDRGKVILGSSDLTHVAARERGIGLVFQDALLFPSLNTVENVAFGLRVRGESRRAAEAVALRWLTRIGLESLARSPVWELSGGERQRVALLRALVWKPRAILLDEPFSALDPVSRALLRQELLRFHEEHPVPLILVTHDSEDLEQLVQRRFHIEETSGGSVRTVLTFESPRA